MVLGLLADASLQSLTGAPSHRELLVVAGSSGLDIPLLWVQKSPMPC